MLSRLWATLVTIPPPEWRRCLFAHLFCQLDVRVDVFLSIQRKGGDVVAYGLTCERHIEQHDGHDALRIRVLPHSGVDVASLDSVGGVE